MIMTQSITDSHYHNNRKSSEELINLQNISTFLSTMFFINHKKKKGNFLHSSKALFNKRLSRKTVSS